MPGDHVDEHGLAGAIGADDADDLARRDGDIQVLGSDDGAETLVHLKNFEHQARDRLKIVSRPLGAKKMRSTSVAPMMNCHASGASSSA